MKTLHIALQRVVNDLYHLELSPQLTRPDAQFGEYATNIALQVAGRVGEAPRKVAEQIAEALHPLLKHEVQEISVAGPGFINFRLTDAVVWEQALRAPNVKLDTYKDKVVVAEYSDPNPFKVMHAGHLYTTVVGDAIARLIEAAGAKVHRVNFGGDVGLHVAKTMWAMLRDEESGQLDDAKTWEFVQDLAKKPLQERTRWMAQRYVVGNNAYDDNEDAKAAIVDLNKKVYQLHEENDNESVFAHIYWTCRNWSYEYFDAVYEDLAVHPFEKYYPESATAKIGLETVRGHMARGVYEESEGATVFKGEAYGLHTRVFINSQGLPTYETKDVGLIMLKWADYQFDLSVIITATEQQEYMSVVLKSIEQFAPQLAQGTVHLTHGLVKMSGGVKMSSRRGNILLASDVLKAGHEAAERIAPDSAKETSLAAVKYAFLKQRIGGGDIIYNPNESVSLEGNSGPYLQYAHARARSILAKTAKPKGVEVDTLDSHERMLARKIGEYESVVEKATDEFMPHHICMYLYELSQTFNRFYEQSRVINDPRQALRLQLVETYANVLRSGLALLGISAPNRL